MHSWQYTNKYMHFFILWGTDWHPSYSSMSRSSSSHFNSMQDPKDFLRATTYRYPCIYLLPLFLFVCMYSCFIILFVVLCCVHLTLPKLIFCMHCSCCFNVYLNAGFCGVEKCPIFYYSYKFAYEGRIQNLVDMPLVWYIVILVKLCITSNRKLRTKFVYVLD